MTILRVHVAVAIGMLTVSVAQAQEPPIDNLIAQFVEHGTSSGWLPNELFKGCPALAPWQERGIQRLMSAQLSTQRIDDLAKAWMVPLRDCRSRRLEQWYFEQLNAAIAQGHGEMMFGFWTALDNVKSPQVRDFLRGTMLNPNIPVSIRDLAGGKFFARLTPTETWHEYLRAFETRQLPLMTASTQTERLLERDAERLLRDVGQRLSANPLLADQTAFIGIVESSGRYANNEARRRLGETLEMSLIGSAIAGDDRDRLNVAAQNLKRPSRN